MGEEFMNTVEEEWGPVGRKICFNPYETFEYAAEKFMGWINTKQRLSFFVYGTHLDLEAMVEREETDEKAIEMLEEVCKDLREKPNKTGTDFADMVHATMLICCLKGEAKANPLDVE